MSCLRRDCENPAQDDITLIGMLCKQHEQKLRDKWITEGKAKSAARWAKPA